jgi:hypothetical protein
MPLQTLFADAPAELARGHAELLRDLDDARRAVATNDALLAQRTSAQRQIHATQTLRGLESAGALSWLTSLTPDRRSAAIVSLARLALGTLAAQKLAYDLFAVSPHSPFARLSGPLIARLSCEPPSPFLFARLAAALAPHLDSSRAEALRRLAEATLGHTLSTREYVGLQDLANLSPETAAAATLTHADLLFTLGEASAPSGDEEPGARLVADFHRAWQVREPDGRRWWPAPAHIDPECPVDWVAQVRNPLASSIVWSLAGTP